MSALHYRGCVPRLAAILCVFAGLAAYPDALRAQGARTMTAQAAPTIAAKVAPTITAQAAAAVAARPETPAAGAADGDVTIVEFLDYNCPFCKKTAPELQKLLRADQRVRILYKEWPIFGDVSEYAARSALAANWQGKFLAAHDALISAPQDLDETSQVDAILKGAGVDLRRLAEDRKLHAADIDADLARNAAEARSLGIRGTPAFLIGRQLVPLALTLEQLQHLAANARAAP
jgi:protein-disulfide isomerase